MQEIKPSNGTIGKVFGVILILLSIALVVFALTQDSTECTAQPEVLQNTTVQPDNKFNF